MSEPDDRPEPAPAQALPGAGATHRPDVSEGDTALTDGPTSVEAAGPIPSAAPADTFSVSISVPRASWITIDVSPFADQGLIYATSLEDPFPDMIRWLEDIAAGADQAIWAIDDEAGSVRLTWLGLRGWGDRQTYLIYCYTHCGEVRMKSAQVKGRDLVAAFYGAARAMANHPDYDPFEWDDHGSDLRELWSARVEAYLAEAGDPEPWEIQVRERGAAQARAAGTAERARESRRPDRTTPSVKAAAIARLAPICAEWSNKLTQRRQRSVEQWTSLLGGTNLFDEGFRIAIRLSLQGMDDTDSYLIRILEDAAPILEEEKDRAIRAWVIENDLAPTLVLGARALWGKYAGHVAGCDTLRALYWFKPDNPHVGIDDPRGIAVAYEALTAMPEPEATPPTQSD